MKVFLIILGVLFSLWLIFRIFLKFSINTSNPIDGITNDGTMGFRIGDSKSFTLSRIKHLKMASKEEWEEYNDRIYGDSFSTSENLFGHIKNVSFDFSQDKLSKISVWFDKQPNEIPEFFEIVEYRISQKLGKPTYKGKGISKWRNQISLFYDVTASKEEDKVLFLFIADYI